MFIQSLTPISKAHSNPDALVAIMTLSLIGYLVYAFTHSKPPIRRALLRLMFQPVLATTLFFTLWLSALLFCVFVSHLTMSIPF